MLLEENTPSEESPPPLENAAPVENAAPEGTPPMGDMPPSEEISVEEMMLNPDGQALNGDLPPSDAIGESSWWSDLIAVPNDLSTQLVTLRLCEAVAIGLVIGLVYFIAQRKRFSEGIAFATTTILLTILVAMSTMVIGSNVARAFSLVGALSIVRFRTVVEDTRDTAFVIFSVVAGMAIGAGNFGVCLIGVPLVSLTAIGLASAAKRIGQAGDETTLEVRLGGGLDPASTLADPFAEFASETRLLSAATARQGAAIEVRYRIRLKTARSPLELLRAINRIEGVQHVEFRSE